jgi:ribokinase
VTGPAAGRGLLVLGSLNTDLVLRVPALPTGGETVLGEDTGTSPGGKGANQAVAAALAGAEVTMAGRVGHDDRAATVLAALDEAGVDSSCVTATGRSTGLAVVLVTEDGENAIVVAPGANHAVEAADVDGLRDRIAGARLLLLQLELPIDVVARAARVAAEVGTPVVLNLAPAAEVAAEVLEDLAVLVVNRSEAAFLVGEPVPDRAAVRRAAELLRDRGPAAVVVTAGADGAVLADADGTTEVEATPVEVVDTTGAGDAFVGVLAARLTQGRSLRAALEDAGRAAAAAVQVHGARLTSLDVAGGS